MVVQFNPSSHTGSATVSVAGSHQVNNVTVTQGGQAVVTLNAAGLADYRSQAQAIARGDFVVING